MYLKSLYVFILFEFFTFTSASNWKDNLRKGLEDYARTRKESPQLRSALSDITFPRLYGTSYTRKEKDLMGKLVCDVCNIALDVVITSRRNGANLEELGDMAKFICNTFVLKTPAVCNGVVDLNKEIIAYVIDNNEELTSDTMCSVLLQEFKCPDPDRQDWNINITERPPDLPSTRNQKEGNSYKILQLTDMHYDPNYEIGSSGSCLEPLCCQAGSTAARTEDRAGFWGDYRNCDLPWHSIVDVLDHVVYEHSDVDFVYFTGDIINHKVWDTNVEDNKKYIRKVYRRLKHTFGYLNVYPIIGNHEPHPVNMFSSELIENNHYLSTKWVFELAAEEWLDWLPEKEAEQAKKTILKGGYYTVSPKPGFRIVALNSNVCYTLNFWLLLNNRDPFDQLQWLANTLQMAEANQEQVHILSHVPSGGTSCFQNWADEFVKIIYRYSHIIAAQFNGHTHKDDAVILFSNDENQTPVSVAFNGGSLTPYSDLNPNYKVYELNSSTHEVIDFESWSYNLTLANADPQFSPKWEKLYSFIDSYSIPNMSLTELANIPLNMTQKDSGLAQLYYRYKYRESDTSLAKGCDSDCEIDNICYMVTFVQSNNAKCEELTKMYHDNHQTKP